LLLVVDSSPVFSFPRKRDCMRQLDVHFFFSVCLLPVQYLLFPFSFFSSRSPSFFFPRNAQVTRAALIWCLSLTNTWGNFHRRPPPTPSTATNPPLPSRQTSFSFPFFPPFFPPPFSSLLAGVRLIDAFIHGRGRSQPFPFCMFFFFLPFFLSPSPSYLERPVPCLSPPQVAIAFSPFLSLPFLGFFVPYVTTCLSDQLATVTRAGSWCLGPGPAAFFLSLFFR